MPRTTIGNPTPKAPSAQAIHLPSSLQHKTRGLQLTQKFVPSIQFGILRYLACHLHVTTDVKTVVTSLSKCGTSEKNSFGGHLPQVGPMRPPPQVPGAPPGQANSEQRYLKESGDFKSFIRNGGTKNNKQDK